MFDVIKDLLLVITRGDCHAQELCRIDVLLTEELAVASSAIHQIGW